MDQRIPFPMQQGYFEHGQRMHGGGLGWAIFALLLLLVLLVLTQLVLTAWRPRFAGPRHGGPPWHGPDPGAVARMRYARGEISRDEYTQLTQDLGGEPAPPAPPAPPPA